MDAQKVVRLAREMKQSEEADIWPMVVCVLAGLTGALIFLSVVTRH